VAKAGALERRIVEILWEGGELSVRGVLDRLGSDHAYTTIMTVLDRLHRKGEVVRHKVDGAWMYRAAESREETIGREVARLLVEEGRSAPPLFMAFLDEAEALDPAALDQLEALIRQRRAERKS
jgi:predicted transcriptional regulator